MCVCVYIYIYSWFVTTGQAHLLSVRNFFFFQLIIAREFPLKKKNLHVNSVSFLFFWWTQCLFNIWASLHHYYQYHCHDITFVKRFFIFCVSVHGIYVCVYLTLPKLYKTFCFLFFFFFGFMSTLYKNLESINISFMNVVSILYLCYMSHFIL